MEVQADRNFQTNSFKDLRTKIANGIYAFSWITTVNAAFHFFS